MHVAFIDNVCNPDTPGEGGHSDIIWAMAEGLVDLDVRVTIVGPYRSQRYPFHHPLLEVSTFPPLRDPDRNGFTRIANVVRAFYNCRKIHDRIDLIHVTEAFSAGIIGVLSRPNTGCLYHFGERFTEAIIIRQIRFHISFLLLRNIMVSYKICVKNYCDTSRNEIVVVENRDNRQKNNSYSTGHP